VYEGSRRAYQETMDLLDDLSGDFSLSQSVYDFLDKPRAYSPVIYQKGALFFDELRREIGDAAFFSAVQSYYNANKYQLAVPEDLLTAFETSCACRLDRFYASWGVTR
jgi:aminopeptidase N